MKIYQSLCFVVALAAINPAVAEVKQGAQQGNTVYFELDDGRVALTAVSSSAFEVHYQPEGIRQLPSFAIDQSIKDMAQQVSFAEQKDSFTVTLPGISARINKVSERISYYRKDKLLLAEETGLFNTETLRGFRFALQANEQVIGGGQRVLGMDRRGQRMPLYNKAHYGYNGESAQMYYGLPAVMSSNMYFLAFDNSAAGHLDIGATEHEVLQFEAVAGRTAYIVGAGDTYADLTRALVEVTGRQPLPPRWALGNYASRFGYRTQQEVFDTIDKFIELDFPVDALVLDLYWFGPDIKGHMGNLHWDNNTFPEPKKMISRLAEQGVETILITEPFILTTSSQWQAAQESNALATNLAGQAKTFDFYFGNTGLVDVFSENGQNWFWQHYERLSDYGVSGWWGDLGEPEVHPSDSLHRLGALTVTADEIHNAYGHQWAKFVYEGMRKLQTQQRPFIMMRSGFLGSQRYGMVPWTGDVDRSWGGLKPQVELALQMSMFGLNYIHSDLGGFAGGDIFDPELYARWMQYGVFQPVYRPHAQEHIAPEPVFHDEKTQSLTREFIKLRYAMLPYNYSMAIQNSLDGTPMMRPVYFEQSRADVNNIASYMWGEAFLVTPVTAPQVRSAAVALPKGVWFDFWSAKKWQGEQVVMAPAPLHQIPVMVKAGSFVPMANPMQNTKEYDPSQLNITYYHDASITNSQYVMLEDDGVDPKSLAQQRFQSITFNAQSSKQSIAISIDVKGEYASAPKQRQLAFTMRGIERAPKVCKVGAELANCNYDAGTKALSLALNLEQRQTISLTWSVE